MSNFASKIAGLATLALGVLPAAALTATAAHAGTVPAHVRIADIDFTSKAGQATYAQRVQAASFKLCRDEKTISGQETCEAAVRAEANQKVQAVLASASELAAR